MVNAIDWNPEQAINPFVEVEINWGDLVESKTWLTAGRIRIPICEMETSHIKNTLRCLKGESKTKIPHNWNGKTHQRWIELLNEELIKRENKA